jgi:hypothetical protein
VEATSGRCTNRYPNSSLEALAIESIADSCENARALMSSLTGSHLWALAEWPISLFLARLLTRIDIYT